MSEKQGLEAGMTVLNLLKAERLKEEARALELERQAEAAKAEEAARQAAVAKAEAEAKLAEAQKAIEAADAAREAKAAMAKQQSKTSEVFKSAMMSNENKVLPGISAIASAEGYNIGVKPSEDQVKGEAVRKNTNPLSSFRSGSSSGVGAAASSSVSGPSISKERAKASSNSNQLGSLLAGKSYNGSGRAPVWAAPGMNVSAFKESDEAKEARMREEQKRLEEEEAKRLAEEKSKSSYTSIADSAKTHKSAFFKRAQSDREQASQDGHSSAYGGIVRPSAIVDEERDIRKSAAPAMGSALEGQRPSIMDPNSKAAPTASRPLKGFKPITSSEPNTDVSSVNEEDKEDIS